MDSAIGQIGAVRRHRGQIMIITLLAMVLLASLVFFVFNTGEQVNKRTAMQNAADSAAIGGATWMARSMNVIAMNNVAQSRLIALAAILDSLPLATQLTYNELNTLAEGIQAQLADPKMNDPQLALVKTGMNSMLNNSNGRAHGVWNTPGLLVQVNRLAPLYKALWNGTGSAAIENPVVMQETYWQVPGQSGPPPHGTLWIGLKALEDFNLATYNTAGPLAQGTAGRMASDCMMGAVNTDVPADMGAAFLVPVLPDLPAFRGSFLDFKSPIMNGTPPERVAGTTSDQFQRGPYDQLYQWRYGRFDRSQSRTTSTGNGQWVVDNPPVRSGAGNIAGKPGLSPGPPGANGGNGHWSGGGTTVYYPGPQIGWTVYGVYSWALTVSGNWRNNGVPPNSGVVWYCNNYVPDLPTSLFPGGGGRGRRGLQPPIDPSKTSNFLTRMQAAATAKLNYMWGAAASESVSIHHPNWICNYDNAKQAATANPASVVYTWIWGVRVRSQYSPGDARYMKDPATYAVGNGAKINNPQQDPTFVCNLLPGWVDPNDPANAPQFGATVPVGPGVWRTDWTYQVEYDTDVGIPKPPVAPVPPPGTPAPPPVMHTIYVRDFFVMFGIDTGGSDVVRNPANWGQGFEQPNPAVDLNLQNTTLAPPRPFRLDMRPNFANATYDTRQVPDVLESPLQPGAYQFLSFLGVAHVTSKAVMWPGGFVSGDPARSVMGIAQAHVFNNQSWDLWTQHWEVQLEPIAGWDYWVNQRMKNATAADFAAIGGFSRLSVEDFNAVLNVLDKYPAEMADKIKTH